MHFTHIAALYSELVAVSSAGHLCQWRWNDVEPYANLEVSRERRLRQCYVFKIDAVVFG